MRNELSRISGVRVIRFTDREDFYQMLHHCSHGIHLFSTLLLFISKGELHYNSSSNYTNTIFIILNEDETSTVCKCTDIVHVIKLNYDTSTRSINNMYLQRMIKVDKSFLYQCYKMSVFYQQFPRYGVTDTTDNTKTRDYLRFK